MRFESCLDCISALPQPEDFSQVRRDLDPEWIEAALLATDTATLRKRRFPAQQAIWLVIGMALFRNKSITEVASSLDLALPSRSGEPTAARSAVSAARSRLGEEPLAWLFCRSADEWAHASADRERWRGLALYGVDGTTLRVADSEDNSDHFGYARGHRGNSGYPVVWRQGGGIPQMHRTSSAAFLSGWCSHPFRAQSSHRAAVLWSSVGLTSTGHTCTHAVPPNAGGTWKLVVPPTRRPAGFMTTGRVQRWQTLARASLWTPHQLAGNVRPKKGNTTRKEQPWTVRVRIQVRFPDADPDPSPDAGPDPSPDAGPDPNADPVGPVTDRNDRTIRLSDQHWV
jgi:hypothetical protein